MHPELLSNLYSRYFEISVLGRAVVALLSLYAYRTVGTDFVYRTLGVFR